MNCKSCGEPIPSFLLRQDSFKCPNCGKTYRRSGSQSSEPASRKAAEDKAARKAPRQKTARVPSGSNGLPGWLVPAIAAVLVLALVGFGGWFLGRRGSFAGSGISGVVKPGKLAVKKSVETTIEIPDQKNTDYMIVTEANQLGLSVAINDKTPTSFDLIVRNSYTKDRNPTVSWALVPCKQPEE